MKRIIFLLSIFTFITVSSWTQSSLTLPSGDPNMQPYYTLLVEAYNKLGIEIIFEDVPSERGIQAANAGTYDGDPVRVAGIEKQFPNLIPVKVPFTEALVYAYTKASSSAVGSAADLNGKKIVIVRGRKAAEAVAKGQNLIFATTVEQALKMVDSGRADILVDIFGLVEPDIEKLGLIDEIIFHEPALLSIPAFHYLHKKNSSLIPKIQEVLQEMKNSGRMQEIIAGN